MIPFGGMNNTVQLDIPITISSGVVPGQAAASSSDYTRGEFAAPPLYDRSADPPALDLPPYALAIELGRML